MAQYTLNAAMYPRPYRSYKGSPPILHLQCSTCITSAVISVGMLVTENTVVTTGGARIVRAPSSGGAAGNLLEYAGITSFLGVAAESDTSVGSTAGLSDPNVRKIPVWLAGETEFLMWTIGNGVVGSTGLMIGQTRAVRFDATLQTYFVDSTNSTAALASVVITAIPDYSRDSSNGPVVVKFISSGLSAIAHA